MGAVHYVSYCTTKRAVLNLPAFSSSSGSSSRSKREGEGGPSETPSGSSTSSSSSSSREAGEHHSHVVHSHGVMGSHYLPHSSIPNDIQEASGDLDQQQTAAAGANPSAGPLWSLEGGKKPAVESAAAGNAGEAVGVGTAATGRAAGGAAGGTSAAAVRNDASGIEADAKARSRAANVLAAVLAAAATAVVEAPLELFRHSSQAGQFQGNFVKEMWKVSLSCFWITKKRL